LVETEIELRARIALNPAVMSLLLETREATELVFDRGRLTMPAAPAGRRCRGPADPGLLHAGEHDDQRGQPEDHGDGREPPDPGGPGASPELLVTLGELGEVPLELADLLQGRVGLQRQPFHLSAALGQGERAGSTVGIELHSPTVHPIRPRCQWQFAPGYSQRGVEARADDPSTPA